MCVKQRSFDPCNSCEPLINDWFLAVYMSYTGQNLHLLHVSNLSVLKAIHIFAHISGVSARQRN